MNNVFAADQVFPANIVVSIIVFLFIFTILVPVAKNYSTNALSIIVLAGSIAFIAGFSVYTNPLFSSFLFDFAPYLIVLVLVGSFIFVLSMLKNNKARLLVILMTLIIVLAFLALNGNIFSSFNINSIHDETILGSDIGLFIIAASFVALIVYSLLMIFK